MIIERRMTCNPVTVSPDMCIREADEIMKREKLHRLPVLDKNKKLVGVISEKDILRSMPSMASTLSVYEMQDLYEKLTVKKVMKQNPPTIYKGTTIEEAARVMVDLDLSCLPVIDNNKNFVGIVSKSDLFKILLELFGARHFGVRVEFMVEDKPGVLGNIAKALADCDMDVVSCGTFMGTAPTNMILTMKVQHGTVAQVIDVIKPFVMEILDVREV